MLGLPVSWVDVRCRRTTDQCSRHRTSRSCRRLSGVKERRVVIEAMEARSVDAIPTGKVWLYEPKWDGFRCLLVREGEQVDLHSKSGQNLNRYFPEVIAGALMF